MRYSVKQLSLGLVMVLALTGLIGADEPPPVVRESRLLGEGNNEFELGGIALAGSGPVAIAALERKPSAGASLEGRNLVLWLLDKPGEVRRVLPLDGLDPEAAGGPVPRTFGEVKDLIALPGGDFLALVTVDREVPAILRLDREGKREMFQRIAGLGSEVRLEKLVALSDELYLALGHRALDFMLIALDSKGAVLWRKVEDAGAMDLLADGVATDGGFILVGSSGEYDILFRGPSKIWLKRYDNRGNIISERSLPGRRPRIDGLSGDRFGLIYDESSSDAQQVRLEVIGLNLETVWKREVLNSESGYSTFDVDSSSKLGIVVAGARQERPFLTLFDAQGKKRWEFWGKDLLPADDYKIVMLGETLLVGSSVFAAGEGEKLSQRVRLIEIVPR